MSGYHELKTRVSHANRLLRENERVNNADVAHFDRCDTSDDEDTPRNQNSGGSAKHDSAFDEMIAAGIEPDRFTIDSERETIEPDEQRQNQFDSRGERALPTTPHEFGELFPSPRKITIRHDDATFDGNYNLRLDTYITLRNGSLLPVTLFHLKIHDLERRIMSLRRYCRDSGREVCNTTCVPKKRKIAERPSIKRSISSAFGNLKLPMASKLSVESRDTNENPSSTDSEHEGCDDIMRNDEIHLDFSTYAQMKVARRWKRKQTRYEFEYWGVRYYWKTVDTVIGSTQGRAYRLCQEFSNQALANIVPQPLTAREMLTEETKGGWILPSVMWIEDESLRNRADVAEYVLLHPMQYLSHMPLVRSLRLVSLLL